MLRRVFPLLLCLVVLASSFTFMAYASTDSVTITNLEYLEEGGFYWLDSELRENFQGIPCVGYDFDPDITDHSHAPKSIVWKSWEFQQFYEDDNVYLLYIDGVSTDLYYTLKDWDGTGYYTCLIGSPCYYKRYYFGSTVTYLKGFSTQTSLRGFYLLWKKPDDAYSAGKAYPATGVEGQAVIDVNSVGMFHPINSDGRYYALCFDLQGEYGGYVPFLRSSNTYRTDELDTAFPDMGVSIDSLFSFTGLTSTVVPYSYGTSTSYEGDVNVYPYDITLALKSDLTSSPSLADMPWNDSTDWTGEVVSVVDESNSLFRFSREFTLTQDKNFTIDGDYLIWGSQEGITVPQPLMVLPNWAQASVNLRFTYRVEYTLDGVSYVSEQPVDTRGKFYCWTGTSSGDSVEWAKQQTALSFTGSSISLPSLTSGRLQYIDLNNLSDVVGWSAELYAKAPEYSLPDGSVVDSEGFSVSLDVSLSFYSSSGDDWIAGFPVDQWVNYDMVFPDFSGIGSAELPDDFMDSLKDDADVLLVASIFNQALSWSLIKQFCLIVLALAIVKFIIVG